MTEGNGRFGYYTTQGGMERTEDREEGLYIERRRLGGRTGSPLLGPLSDLRPKIDTGDPEVRGGTWYLRLDVVTQRVDLHTHPADPKAILRLRLSL